MLERHRLQVLARIAALVLDEASEGISVGCSESQEGSYVDVVSRSSELSRRYLDERPRDDSSDPVTCPDEEEAGRH